MSAESTQKRHPIFKIVDNIEEMIENKTNQEIKDLIHQTKVNNFFSGKINSSLQKRVARLKYRSYEVDTKLAKNQDFLSLLQQKYALKKNQMEHPEQCIASLQQQEKFRILKEIDTLEQQIIEKELEVLALPSLKSVKSDKVHSHLQYDYQSISNF